MRNLHDCCLCSQIAGIEHNDLIASMLPDQPYTRRVMLESNGFAVIPSLGPLVKGHCLLCPKLHVRSFAHVDRTIHDDLAHVKAVLQRRLRDAYGTEILMFEHGMAAVGDHVPCTIDHAHMHCLPLPGPVVQAMSFDEEWLQFDGSIAAIQELSSGREYVYCEIPDGGFWLLVSRDRPIASQYMRRVIAGVLGSSERWNWKEFPDPREADRTWREFAGE